MVDHPQPNTPVQLVTGDRPLPHNTEAEIAVLGSILLDPRALDVATSSLNFANSFYDPGHQQIFQTLLTLSNGENSTKLDLVTLTDALNRSGKLAMVGGHQALLKIMNSVPSAANIERYVDIVHQNAILRRLIRKSADILERCYEPQESVKNLLDSIEQEIMEINNLREGSEMVAVGDVIYEAFAYLNRLHEKDPSVLGIQTGFEALDHIIMGLRGGEMFVLAARPSIGKTALALNMAENIALHATRPCPVGIFSLEMGVQQLVLRLLCSMARISLGDIRDCALTTGRWADVDRAAARLKQAPIYIDDCAAQMDVVELRARARRMKTDHNIGVLFIDYLQLLRPVGGNRNSTRENEVAQMSGGIKSLAKELEIPIVVLAQLNRQAEQTGQRPKLSHLRESGAIEQDADVVALLHRERDVENQLSSDGLSGIESELIIAKHRNGQTGVAPLLFIPAYTRFENRSPIADEDVPVM